MKTTKLVFLFSFLLISERIWSSPETKTTEEKIEEAKNESLSQFGGDENLISVHLKDATLRDFLRNISSSYDINFVYSEEIGNKVVSINFKQTPLSEALNAILEIHSLGMAKLSDRIIQIETLQKIQSKKEEVKKTKIASTHLIPTKISIFRLSYAKADALAPVVKELLESSSSNDPRVKVTSNIRTNSLIIEAIPTDLEKVNGLIKRMDLQTPQVKIETRVIEVIKSMTDDFGIDWTAPLRIDKGRGLGFGNLIFPNNMISNFSIDTGATKISGSKFDTHFGSINNSIELDLKIRLSESYNISRSLQNNSIIVLDNEPAKIEAGKVGLFSVEKSQGQTDIIKVEYKLTLDVTPHITVDGSVQLKIVIKNSDPTPIINKEAAAMNERLIDTSLIRKSGETAVIGGLYNTTTKKVTTGIPYLSRIPVLSFLFSSHNFIEDKRELIIMVTPTIINTEKAFSFAENTASSLSKNSKENENNFFNNVQNKNQNQNFNNNNGFNNDDFQENNDFNFDQNSKNNFNENLDENLDENFDQNFDQDFNTSKKSKNPEENSYEDLLEDDALFEKTNDINNEEFNFENFE